MEALRRIDYCEKHKDMSLDLSNLNLASIPDDLTRLYWLENLNLHGNRLNNLENFDFSSLGRLKTLNLSQNRIEIIPNSIQSLAPRKALKEIKETDGLLWLDLSQNLIKEMHESIFMLTSLITLDLHDNQIQVIPDEIDFLYKLSYLDLSGNQIALVSHHISNLNSIDDFRINANPIAINILPEMLGIAHERPPNSQILVDYFSNQLQEIQEAKVLLVGEGDVGKSSIIQRLLYNQFRERNPKTDGIDVHKWKIKVQRDDGRFRRIRLNFWDFGGQEIYHSTHRFFLTQRSLYLLVINSRRDFTNRVNYWLTTIRNHVKDPQNAPVIIVANKIDENPSYSINITDLRRFYPNIVGIVRVSCFKPEAGDGINALHRLIKKEISTLNHVFSQIPASWLRAKDKLEIYAREGRVLSYNEYKNLCKSAGVDDDQIENLITLFHDLGTILNYYDPNDEHHQDEDTKILDPNWVTQGVFSIIKKGTPYIHNGIINKKDLKFLLDKNNYPTLIHRTFIIEMMRKYELSFPFSEGNRYLIPDLLPEEEPEIDWLLDKCLRFEYYYPDFLPQTIISKFIVRQQAFIIDKENPKSLWRTGCVIWHGSNEALIRAEKGQKISVFVHGSGIKRETLGIIRSDFTRIHAQFEGLQYEERVPIPNYPNAFVEYKYLKASEKHGNETVWVRELDDFVLAKPLLDGIDEPKSKKELRKILRSKMNEQEFKTFLSDFCPERYAYEDLSGEGLSDKIREFLDKVDRMKDLNNLIEFLKTEQDYLYISSI